MGLSTEQVRELFDIRSPSDVESFLSSVSGSDTLTWSPVGGKAANASNIEVLTDPGPAIVERVTNAIDAILELGQASHSESPVPASPREAARAWYGLPGGSLDPDRDRLLIAELAPTIRVELFDSGVSRRPSIAVSDRGIGKHPDDVMQTILSLSEDNKIGASHLCGAYGHGGSSTFAWCDYTILVTRTRPEHSSGRPDRVGWSIVRRYDDDSLKLYTYQCLTSGDGAVPSFTPEKLDGTGFDFGTLVLHVAFQAERLAPDWSLVGYRFLNNILFDPVLPYSIRDNREARPQNRYMYGTRARLGRAQPEYSNEYERDLGPDGRLTVRYWVLRGRSKSSSVDSEDGADIGSYLDFSNSNRTVLITYNGQRHEILERIFVKEKTKYKILSDDIIVQVDCDGLSRSRLKGLFSSTRAGVPAGERRKGFIEEAVIRALENDDDLSKLEEKRLRERLARADEENEKRVKRLLDKLIGSEFSRSIIDVGGSLGRGRGRRQTGTRFRPSEPPTFFRFADERSELRLEAGDFAVIDLVTDASNNLLTRRRHKADLRMTDVEGLSTVRRGALNDGRMSLTVRAAEDASVGLAGELRAELLGDGGLYFASTRRWRIVAPPPPYVGVDPPSSLSFLAGRRPVRLPRGRATKVSLETDCVDDLLTRDSGPAVLEVTISSPGVAVEARRGPKSGRIELFLVTSESTQLTIESERVTIGASLRMQDGFALSASTEAVVVDAERQTPRRGTERRQVPNYRIVDVWEVEPPDNEDVMTWDRLGPDWDGERVGTYEARGRETEDGSLLVFYVNMDFRDLKQDRLRRIRGYSESRVRALNTRYQAYLAHHMYQHWADNRRDGGQASVSSGVNGETDEGNLVETDLQPELRRVARTLILTMQSQSTLAEEPD